MYDPLSFTIQRTSRLFVQQCAGGWIIWIAGTPATRYNSYLILYNNGRIEQHTDGGDDDVRVKVIQEEEHDEQQ
jgi:hypothetical protein